MEEKRKVIINFKAKERREQRKRRHLAVRVAAKLGDEQARVKCERELLRRRSKHEG